MLQWVRLRSWMSILPPNSFNFILNIQKTWGSSKLSLRREGSEGSSSLDTAFWDLASKIYLYDSGHSKKETLYITSIYFDLTLSKACNREWGLPSVLLIVWFLFGNIIQWALWYTSWGSSTSNYCFQQLLNMNSQRKTIVPISMGKNQV